MPSLPRSFINNLGIPLVSADSERDISKCSTSGLVSTGLAWLGRFDYSDRVSDNAVWYPFFLRPKFSVKEEHLYVDGTEEPKHKYGYWNLVVTNNGHKDARDCELRITIKELEKNYENMTLFWLNPRYKKTKKDNVIAIRRGPDRKITTNIFEIDEGRDHTIIETQEGHDLRIEMGKTYTFILTVVGTPYTRKKCAYSVQINARNDISVNDR